MADMNEEIFPVDGDDDDVVVTLAMDDGSEVTCEIITIFTVEELNRDYIVLLPINDKGENTSDGEVYLYRYEEEEDGTPWLDNIASDDEYDKVSQVFENLPLFDDEEE